MTVEQLLNTISAAELAEWEAFYMIEPFGPQNLDYHFSRLCSYTLAPHCKRGQAPEVSSLMWQTPTFAGPDPVTLRSKILRAFGVK